MSVGQASTFSLSGGHNPLLRPIMAGAVAGLGAGILSGVMVNSNDGLIFHLLLCTILGVGFGLTFGTRLQTIGEALIWGESFGLLWWLVGTTTLVPLLTGQELLWTIDSLSTTFPQLLLWVFGYGVLMGLFYLWMLLHGTRFLGLGQMAIGNQHGESGEQADIPSRVGHSPYTIGAHHIHALFIGGFAGLIGSWIFEWGIDTANFYPLVSGLVGMDSMTVGRALHYLIGGIIGISFGFLFHHNLRGPGNGIIWGLNYGMVWWVLGPLTLVPILGFGGIQHWTFPVAQALFPSLISHLLYGAVVGYVSGLLDRLWQTLFVDSDPLNRIYEGSGTQGVRALWMGLIGGVIGGLLFSVLMVSVGALPSIARLVGAQSAFAGFLVHLLISVIIGVSYGLLFQKLSVSYGSGLAWGMLYGWLWWLLGTLTLYPLLLRQSPDWSLVVVVDRYPSLIGHLLYGAGLGFFFQYLSIRYAPVPYQVRYRNREVPPPVIVRQRQIGTPAPALWAVTLLLGLILPLLMSAN